MRQSKFVLLAVSVVLLAGIAATTGCRRVKLADDPALGTVEQTQTVPLGGATALRTKVTMGVGALRLSADESSSTLAMNATFACPRSLKPEVKYAVEATRGTLSVVQPQVSGLPGMKKRNDVWRLALARGVPTELSLEMGVGEGKVDLRGIDVTSLDVDSGVGAMTLDLSGPRSHDVTARIESGVGELNLIVPSGVGVRIAGLKDGLGDETKARGFSESGGGLVNSAWSKPGPKIRLTVDRGIGDITITSAE